MITLANGLDLVEINRFKTINPKIKVRFCQRVFTEKEIIACNGIDESFAGRFAAKEATAKALGCGIGLVHWHDVEILLDENGKPILYLHGDAKQLAKRNGWTSWSVSITHTSSTAAAVVTAILEVPNSG